MIRPFKPEDLELIKKIHALYFKDEFTLEDFLDPHTTRAWVSGNPPICVGGIRLIPEAVMITDKSFSAEERKDAFLQLLSAMMSYCREYQFPDLHVNIHDEKWARHLKTVGFVPTKGQIMVLKV